MDIGPRPSTVKRFCKDTRCKDNGPRSLDSQESTAVVQGLELNASLVRIHLVRILASGHTAAQNGITSHRKKKLLHLIVQFCCFGLVLNSAISPSISLSPANFSQRYLLGNKTHTCPHCSCFLGEWAFYSSPKLFRAQPFYLPNGMMVYKTKFCYAHTSIWYFRRGKRKYGSFTGAKQFHIHKQLELAGPPSACRETADHSLSISLLTSQTHLALSGHGSCCAAKGRNHQCLRSQDAMVQRHASFNERQSEIDCNTDNTLPLPLTGKSSPFLVQSALCLRCKIVITPKDDAILPTPTSPHFFPGLPSLKIMSLKIDLMNPLPHSIGFHYPKANCCSTLGASKLSLVPENMNNSSQ